MPTFRAALVQVVSDPQQAAEGHHSLDEQLRANRLAAERLEATVVAEISFQHSRSYDVLAELVTDSADYRRFIELVNSEAVNLAIFWRSDRVARTARLALEVQALCKSHGVQLYYSGESGAPPMDPGEYRRREPGVDESMLDAIRGVMSETEVRRLVARSMAGKRGRAQSGLHMNWSCPPTGYRAQDGDHSKPLVIVPEEAAVVRLIFDLRAQGYGYEAIVKRLREMGDPGAREAVTWYHGAVAKILRNPFYVGRVLYRRRNQQGEVIHEEEFEGQHEAIIDEATWEAVQRINRARRRAYSRRGQTPHLLSGLPRCAYCGDAMSYNRKRRAVLRCAKYQRTGGKCCQYNGHQARAVEVAVHTAVVDLICNPETYREAQASRPTRDNGREAILETQIDDLAQRQERLMRALELGTLPSEQIGERYNELDAQRRQAQKELDDLRHSERRAAAMEETLLGMQDVVSTLGEAFAAAQGGDEEAVVRLRRLYGTLVREVRLAQDVDPVIVWVT